MSVQIRKDSSDLRDKLLVANQRWYRNIFRRDLIAQARQTIDLLLTKSDRDEKEIHRLSTEVDAGARVHARIIRALEEMRRQDSRGMKEEVPFAVLMSPKQNRYLTQGGWLSSMANQIKVNGPMGSVSLPIYTAKGVYGPLVVTEEAFKAIARQAPELLLKGGISSDD